MTGRGHAGTTPRWVRYLVWPARGEAGSSTIELVIFMPLLLLMLFTGAQAAAMYHARSVAIAAAQEGARVAAAQGSTIAAGAAAAEQFVTTTAGGGVLSGLRIHLTRTATTATAHVSGTSLSLVPGWTPTITQSASAPIERLT